jgi:hypothetical protein
MSNVEKAIALAEDANKHLSSHFGFIAVVCTNLLDVPNQGAFEAIAKDLELTANNALRSRGTPIASNQVEMTPLTWAEAVLETLRKANLHLINAIAKAKAKEPIHGNEN